VSQPGSDRHHTVRCRGGLRHHLQSLQAPQNFCYSHRLRFKQQCPAVFRRVSKGMSEEKDSEELDAVIEKMSESLSSLSTATQQTP
jgi:hypothetical protein